MVRILSRLLLLHLTVQAGTAVTTIHVRPTDPAIAVDNRVDESTEETVKYVGMTEQRNPRITADDVMPLLLAACPSFQDIWLEVEKENYSEEENQRLHYIDAGAFSTHLVQLSRTGQTEQLMAALRVIELLHTDGKHDVQELATVGYLEGIQFAVSHVTDVDEEDFVPLLGPESLRWWNGLVKFWNGTVPPPIQPTDET